MVSRQRGQAVFEIEGVPRKAGFFKKNRSYIAAYEDCLVIELDGEKDCIQIEDIYDIYVQESIVEDVTCRTTVVEFYEEGEQNYYELEDDTFDGLAAKMERLQEKEWSHFEDKRNYPDTVKWFIACCAVVYVSSGQNPKIYGSSYKEPGVASEQRKVLRESWGFNKKEDFLAMLPKLYEGRAMKDYRDELKKLDDLDEDHQSTVLKIQEICGEKGIWAWDLQRLILLCSLGYLCDYISYEDSLDWSLKAGQKLQGIYQSWDDFMESYLLGYCYWSGDDQEDEDSEVCQRQRIYDYYKKSGKGPWTIPWSHPLSREW